MRHVADIEDRETEPRGRRTICVVRTEAIRLRHAVGGAVLTVANQCSACFGEHRGKHPLRGLQVRCGCSAIGVALSATPMRNVVLLEWAVGRDPEGDDVRRSAVDDPARKLVPMAPTR